jgi:hypothetical protein
MSTSLHETTEAPGHGSAGTSETGVSATVYGFGQAAAITLLFNTVLAWVKDAWDPLNTFMAHLTGHHWITHGLADVIVFVVLGYVLTSRRHGRTGDGVRLAVMLVVAALLAGGGLGLWFLVT